MIYKKNCNSSKTIILPYKNSLVILTRSVVPAHNICAAICDFQQCGILASVSSDEPVQPPNDVQSLA